MKVILSTLNSKYIHSSLALAYLEAACASQDWDLEILEFTINEQLEDIMASIYQRKADVICFSVYIWNVGEILSISRDLKKVSPHCHIILGGPEVSYDATRVLEDNPAIDCIIRGEGEITLREVLQQISCKKDVKGIKGVTYRLNDTICENPERELISDLNSLASPYMKDFTDYKDRIIYYESSRGCPFNCAYCLSSTIKGVRYFPMERVKNELRHLLKYKVREIKFVDRTFNCNEKRAQEIMQFIVDQKGSTRVHLEICAELLSQDFIDFLGQLPPDIFNFEIGVQSTCPEALKAVRRISNWQTLQRNVLELKSFNNIHLHLDLIAGLPLEDYTRFQQSFNDVYSLQPDMLQLGFLKLLKGSEIFRHHREHAYSFQSRPPYQVLANRYISYDEMIRLKQVEDLLDRYYNNSLVPFTLNYCVNQVYGGNAFRFFEEFAFYWQEQGLFGRGHRRDREYAILLEFLRYSHPEQEMEYNELVKCDFLTRNLPHQFPGEITRIDSPASRDLLNSCLQDQTVINQLPDTMHSSRRELRKYLHIEYFFIDPFTMNHFDKPQPYLFIYHPVEKKAMQVRPIAE